MYRLSKSRFCSGMQCKKMLWLKQHRPELFDESVYNAAALENGNAVGDLAMGLFGPYTEIPYGDLQEMIDNTRRELEQGTRVIAEASFSAEGLFCSVDILRINEDGDAEMYEVKSAAGVKEPYYRDAAFQYHVLSLCNLRPAKCCIVHINGGYVRCGELDLQGLFEIEDVTERVQAMEEEISAGIAELRSYMEQEEEPPMPVGEWCLSPYDCGFFKYCAGELPEKNVFDLPLLSGKEKLAFYRQGLLTWEDLFASGVLKGKVLDYVSFEVTPRPPKIDRESIRSFLDGLSYPLYFLDFEAFQPPVPKYDGTKPFQQIVFQYSLHWLDRPGGELMHTEYLGFPEEDPRRGLAERLCEAIPKDVCILAYNMSYEKGRIGELAALYPDLSEHLLNIRDHVQDLMRPFQKQWYYCREMEGSYSIKHVLPALCGEDPELDYQRLPGVKNGEEASAAFLRMERLNEEERQELRSQLLTYCGLDTLAMVKILEKLYLAAG